MIVTKGKSMTDFTLHTVVERPYEETLERVREHLVEAGFGVLTEIDLAATLRAKLGIDHDPQVILGACRPHLAHQALQADPRIAAMLPCNVVVTYESAERTRVEAFDPAAMTAFSDSPEIKGVADEARRRLSTMIDGLTTEAEGEVHAAGA